MTPVLDVALTNAILAAPLAVLAWASTLLRRPALTHGLWLVVLLRLVAPPLWQVSLPSAMLESTTATPEVIVEPPATVIESTGSALEPAIVTPVIDVAPAAIAAATPVTDWRWFVAGIWFAGTGVVSLISLVRTFAFARFVRASRLAPASWQRTADALATRLGLWQRPRVVVVPGAVSPLVWAGLGRAVVLIPQGLVGSLTGGRRAAILTHELAHLRRGDHIVRWLEVIATAAYWWHPVVWWARRELRECEEQCCDAWVVWALPAARRAYADALVDTVDFLSIARPALPPLASGIGEVRNLRRRITMIMRASVPRRLTRFGLLTGLTLALATLSLSPIRGDDDQPPPPRRDGRGDERSKDERRDEPRERRLDPEKARQADVLREELRALRDRMMQLEEKLAAIEGRPTMRRDNERRPGSDIGPDAEARIAELDSRRKSLMEKLGPSHPQVREIEEQIRSLAARRDANSARGERRDPQPKAKDGERREGDRRPGAPAIERKTDDRRSDGPQAGRGSGPADRLAELEREIQMLRRELAEMRREMRRPDGAGPGPGRPGEPPNPPVPPRPPQPPRPVEQ